MEDENEDLEAMQVDELNEDSGDELNHETIEEDEDEEEEEDDEEEEKEDDLSSSKAVDKIIPLNVSPDAIWENDQEITSFVENDQSNEVF